VCVQTSATRRDEPALGVVRKRETAAYVRAWAAVVCGMAANETVPDEVAEHARSLRDARALEWICEEQVVHCGKPQALAARSRG
jgi:hypothetical protein